METSEPANFVRVSGYDNVNHFIDDSTIDPLFSHAMRIGKKGNSTTAQVSEVFDDDNKDVSRLLNQVHMEHPAFFGTKMVKVLCLTELPDALRNEASVANFIFRLQSEASGWSKKPAFMQLAGTEQFDSYWFRIEEDCPALDSREPDMPYHALALSIQGSAEDTLMFNILCYPDPDYVTHLPKLWWEEPLKPAETVGITCILANRWPVHADAE